MQQRHLSSEIIDTEKIISVLCRDATDKFLYDNFPNEMKFSIFSDEVGNLFFQPKNCLKSPTSKICLDDKVKVIKRKKKTNQVIKQIEEKMANDIVKILDNYKNNLLKNINKKGITSYTQIQKMYENFQKKLNKLKYKVTLEMRMILNAKMAERDERGNCSISTASISTQYNKFSKEKNDFYIIEKTKPPYFNDFYIRRSAGIKYSFYQKLEDKKDIIENVSCYIDIDADQYLEEMQKLCHKIL